MEIDRDELPYPITPFDKVAQLLAEPGALGRRAYARGQGAGQRMQRMPEMAPWMLPRYYGNLLRYIPETYGLGGLYGGGRQLQGPMLRPGAPVDTFASLLASRSPQVEELRAPDRYPSKPRMALPKGEGRGTRLTSRVSPIDRASAQAAAEAPYFPPLVDPNKPIDRASAQAAAEAPYFPPLVDPNKPIDRASAQAAAEAPYFPPLVDPNAPKKALPKRQGTGRRLGSPKKGPAKPTPPRGVPRGAVARAAGEGLSPGRLQLSPQLQGPAAMATPPKKPVTTSVARIGAGVNPNTAKYRRRSAMATPPKMPPRIARRGGGRPPASIPGGPGGFWPGAM